MNNNDILSRLRYALDLKDSAVVEMFALGGLKTNRAEVKEMLTKTNEDSTDEVQMNEYAKEIDNITLESFLNGFINFKRGKQDPKPGQPERPAFSIKNHDSVNNILLKKLKIALALKSEDVLDILDAAGVIVTKGELSALLRKEGHKKYR